MEDIADGKRKLYRRTTSSYGVRYPHEALSLEAIAALSTEGLTRLASHVDAHAQPPQPVARDGDGGPSASPHGNRGATGRPSSHKEASAQHRLLHHVSKGTAAVHQPPKPSNAAPPPPLRLGSDDDDDDHVHRGKERKQHREERAAAQAAASSDARRKDHYVATLEGIVEEAEERHQAVCAMLLSTAVRGAVSELCASEAIGRCAVVEAAMAAWTETMQAVLRRHHVEHTVLHHRIRSLGADHSELKAQSSPIVSTTAQAYVLNDLRQVLDKQHAAQQQALCSTQECVKTVVETHVSTLHHAVARLQDHVHGLMQPVATEIGALSAALTEERRASAAAGHARTDEDEARASQQSLRLAELNGALRVLEDHTRELLSATSSQRQLILEDLSRRAAVDERRVADQNRHLDEHILALKAHQTDTASSALAKAASTTFADAATSSMAQALQPMLADVRNGLAAAAEGNRTEFDALKAQQLQSHTAVQQLPEAIRRELAEEMKVLRAEMKAEWADAARMVAAAVAPPQPSPATVVATAPLPPGAFVVAHLVHMTKWQSTRCDAIDACWAAKCEAVMGHAFEMLRSAPPPSREQDTNRTASMHPDQQSVVASLEDELRVLRSKLAAIEAAEKAKYTAYQTVATPFVPPHALEGVVHVAPRPLSELRSISGVGVALPKSTTTEDGDVSPPPPDPPQHTGVGQPTGMSSSATRRRVSRDVIIPFSSVEVDVATTPDGTGAIGPSGTTSPSATPISPPHRAVPAPAPAPAAAAAKLPFAASMGLGLSSFSPRVSAPEPARVAQPSQPVVAVDPVASAPPGVSDERCRSLEASYDSPNPEVKAARKLSTTRHPLDSDDSLSLDSDDPTFDDDGGDGSVPLPTPSARQPSLVPPAQERAGAAGGNTAAVAHLASAIQRSSFDADDDNEGAGGQCDGGGAVTPAQGTNNAALVAPAPTKDTVPLSDTAILEAAALLESPGRHRRHDAPSLPAPATLAPGPADDGTALAMLRPGGGGAKKKLPTW